MAIMINNEKYLSYEEQVEKNKEDIKELKEKDISQLQQEITENTEKITETTQKLETITFKMVDMDIELTDRDKGTYKPLRWNEDFKYKIIRLHIKVSNDEFTTAGKIEITGFPVYYNSFTYLDTAMYNANSTVDGFVTFRIWGYSVGFSDNTNYVTLETGISNIDLLRQSDFIIYAIDTGYSLIISNYAEY